MSAADHLPLACRAARASDHPALLRLNAASQAVLSPLDERRLQDLVARADWLDVVDRGGEVLAFLMAFREGADYDSPNYRWFARRYPRFLYIDRVVVAQAARGRGCGSLLYQRAFERARSHGVPSVTCEFDLEPPNPASARFHARFGFREVGRQQYGPLRKTVSLQEADSGPDRKTV